MAKLSGYDCESHGRYKIDTRIYLSDCLSDLSLIAKIYMVQDRDSKGGRPSWSGMQGYRGAAYHVETVIGTSVPEQLRAVPSRLTPFRPRA